MAATTSSVHGFCGYRDGYAHRQRDDETNVHRLDGQLEKSTTPSHPAFTEVPTSNQIRWTTASTSTSSSVRTNPATMTVELAGGLLVNVSARTLL